MASYEIVMLVLAIAILCVVIAKMAYDRGESSGYAKGLNNGYEDGYEKGEAQGHFKGYEAGMEKYRSIERELYDRDIARKDAEKEKLKLEIEELNEGKSAEEQFPEELLLIYGVTNLNDLPLDVKQAYGIKTGGGVINEREES